MPNEPTTSPTYHWPTGLSALIAIGAALTAVSTVVPADAPWWARAIVVGLGAGVAALLAARQAPAVVLLLALVLLGPAQGCGSWSSNARHTIEISATVVDTGDHAVELAIVDTCAPALHGLAVGPVRTAALLACLAEHHFDDAIDSIDAADHVLRASQSAVDVGERAGGGGDPTGWQALAPCVLDAVHELVQACTTAGVAIPTALVTGLDALTPVVGMCRPPSTSTSIAATAGGESS